METDGLTGMAKTNIQQQLCSSVNAYVHISTIKDFRRTSLFPVDVNIDCASFFPIKPGGHFCT